MKYIKGTIYTSEAGLEILESRLMDIGIAGLEINDPREIENLLKKKHSYDWDYIDDSVMLLKSAEPSVSFYLSDDDEGKKVQAAAEKLAKEIASEDSEKAFGSMAVEFETVDDADWKDKWKEYFKPAHITEKIVVKPTWEEYDKKDGELIIEIDPGVAFGTGTHPTTTGCMVLMEKYLKKGMSVMDVGCGSGILAIGAGLLGAGDVLGIEIDPDAVTVGRENIALNHVENIARVELGDLTKGVDYKADIIVANLMADLVKMLTGDVAKHLKKGGIYISSGILLELKDELCAFLKDSGFEILEVYENERDGGWCAIAAALKEN